MLVLDLNVVLDVIQERRPHFTASASVIDQVVRRQTQAALPAHAFTTIHYLVARYQNAKTAEQAIDWLLRHFEVATVGHAQLQQARLLGWPDFEDAVVATSAAALGAEAIITRNVKDFGTSPVPALTPDEYLLLRG